MTTFGRIGSAWYIALCLPFLCAYGSSAFSVEHIGRIHDRHGTSALRMATWSDSKAVKDYQEFLSTGRSEPEKKRDCASVIIMEPDKPCELAEALFSMGMGDDVVTAPFYDLPPELDGNVNYPIYVTLPPYLLAEFIQNLPETYLERTDDFVFFSGGLDYGNIEDVLKDYGFCRDAQTQVLISGVRITKEKRVQDLSVRLGTAANEEEKWAGQCTACGKWHGAIAERMFRNDVVCRTDFYREWRRSMWEASLADAVVHLLGVVRAEPTTVAAVATYYYQEVSDIVWEISGQLRGWKALTLTFGFEERLFGVAEATGVDQPCTVNHEMYPFIWGNSVFLQSNMYLEYLQYAQTEMGLLQGIPLPQIDQDKPNIMRQGNLRADGVV